MLGRTFFVLKDTLTANLISSLTILFYFGAAKIMTDMWGYWGLALAQPIQAFLAVGVLAILLFRRIKQFPVGALFRSFLIYSLISLASAAYGWVVVQLLSRFSILIQLAIGGGSSGLVYMALLFAVDREIAISILEMTGLLKIYSAIKTRLTPVHDVPQVR
jgi:peptidoglycan biosynthesis protein MviN/MurJ (putative lipid II flippase)